MTITQAEAITAVRARLDEPTAAYWSDTDIRRWINDIAKDMGRRTESLRATYDQPVVAGTGSYTPAFTSTQNVYRIYRVEYIPENQSMVYPLSFRDPNSADEVWGIMQTITEGIPAIWTSWGFPPALTVQVYPVPSQAGDLRLWYYRLPTQLAIDDNSDAAEVVEIPDGWDDCLVDGVEYKAKLRDNDTSWQMAKQEYEQHLEAMMEATLRFTDSPPQITNDLGLQIPGWLYGFDDAY